MGEEQEREAERLRLAGRRYREAQAEWRRRERQERAERRAITYIMDGLHYRLLPGQRITLPLTHGGTLTFCGEGRGHGHGHWRGGTGA